MSQSLRATITPLRIAASLSALPFIPWPFYLILALWGFEGFAPFGAFYPILALACGFCLVGAPATACAAWQEGIPEDIPIECKEMGRAGAAELAIRVTPTSGSYGRPVLVGLRDGRVLWSKQLPNTQEVNAAQLYASCAEQHLRVVFRNPGDSRHFHQHYRWDGRSLKKTKMFVTGMEWK